MALSFSKAILHAKTTDELSASHQTITITVGSHHFPLRPPPAIITTLTDNNPFTKTKRQSQKPLKPFPSVKQRLQPLLSKPLFSLSTLNLFQSKQPTKDCPALLCYNIDLNSFITSLEDTWTSTLPRKVRSNLKKARSIGATEFIKFRLYQLKKGRRCFNCLSKGHQNSTCKLPLKCILCNATGHSLKHCTLLGKPSIRSKKQYTVNAKTRSTQAPSQPPPFGASSQPTPQPIIEPIPNKEVTVNTGSLSPLPLVLVPYQAPRSPCHTDPGITVGRELTGSFTGAIQPLVITGELLSNGTLTIGRLRSSQDIFVRGGVLLGGRLDRHALPLFSLSQLTIPFAISSSTPFLLLHSVSFPFSLTTTFMRSQDTLSDPQQDPLKQMCISVDPLEPPGFEGPPRYKKQRPTIAVRRSPRLQSKAGTYIPPTNKAELQVYGSTSKISATRKRKASLAQPSLDFMEETGPVNREQAQLVVSLAGFQYSKEIEATIQRAGIEPLP